MTKESNNKDQRALEALLTAAFKLDFPEEIPDEQIIKFFEQPAILPEEIKAACDSWGEDFIEKLIAGYKSTSDIKQSGFEINEELKQELFAMNRDKNGNDIDEETRRKIEEERKKALEEEENKEQDDES